MERHGNKNAIPVDLSGRRKLFRQVYSFFMRAFGAVLR
jgi:hypothetical protein